MDKINSRILLKITLLVIVEIILIVSSFSVLAFFSQQSSLGNTINIAGKNRFLATNLLLQTEKYLDGFSSTSQVAAAINGLQFNIVTLKQGGIISGIDLKPLQSNLLEMWKTIYQNWNVYKLSFTRVALTHQLRARLIDQPLAQMRFESLAYNLVNASDRLVTQLGIQTDRNSQNLMQLQILFAILIVGILVLILYLVTRMLKPIFDLTQATSKLKKGNFDVTVRQKGTDELSILTESFNSMTASIRRYMRDQSELTQKLEETNQKLNNNDKLKNDFISIAAHELRAPLQPILGMAEVLRRRRTGEEKINTSGKEDIEYLDIIIRNAKRLLRLEQNILDMTKIESKSLKLDKERFDMIEKITNVINDFSNDLSKEKIELVFTSKHKSQSEPILVSADKVRIFEVISNLLSNAIKFTANSDKKNAEKRDGEAVVNIKDTGPGIKSEVLPKLFSKFVTNSPGGTGVGLFISKNIIEAHGGKIWAENYPKDSNSNSNSNSNESGNEKGAIFSFSLPLAK
ncbi:sensor histidine kinase [Nitrososphaera sp. AFS]|uniref:sensor histidine kinase n=1 Tax=Nitrososphaera sp. AFS TaxID=2301191 RepID=UPI0013924503|nr:HAMP domain-containing protein [Nitrososphaera sp. AFS]